MHGRSNGRVPRAGARAFAIVACLLATPAPGSSQTVDQARVGGRVIDAASLRPIQDVSVRLGDMQRAVMTDHNGRFLLPGVPLGRYVLIADHLSYGELRDSIVVVERNVTYELEIRLSTEPIALDPIVVEILRAGMLAEVDDRITRMQELGLGVGFDRGAIERSQATRVSHLVGRIPGARLRPIPGRAGANQIRLSQRYDCGPSYYIDGMQVRIGGEAIDDFVPLSTVEAVEVYRRLTELPGEFADEQARHCGAVAIWTRRGQPGGEPFGWTRAVALTGFVYLTYVLGGLLR